MTQAELLISLHRIHETGPRRGRTRTSATVENCNYRTATHGGLGGEMWNGQNFGRAQDSSDDGETAGIRRLLLAVLSCERPEQKATYSSRFFVRLGGTSIAGLRWKSRNEPTFPVGSGPAEYAMENLRTSFKLT